MEKNQLISIILPVHNGEDYLGQSIESCLTQSYTNFELIVVNDCSTDKTEAIISHYAEKDHRIVVINNQTNKKLPASLNIGHKRAKGNFMTWTSDDNIYHENALEVLYHNLVANNADIAYSDFFLIDKSGKIMGEVLKKEKEHLPFENAIGASFLYLREVYETVGGYREDLIYVEDYAFWLEAYSKKLEFFKVNESLYDYRLHEQTLTNETKKGDRRLVWINNLKGNYEKFAASMKIEDNNFVALLTFLHVNSGEHLCDFLNSLRFFRNTSAVSGLGKAHEKLLVDRTKNYLRNKRRQIVRCLASNPKLILNYTSFMNNYVRG